MPEAPLDPFPPAAGPAAPAADSPARPPRRGQAAMLLSCLALPTLAAVLIAPVQPQIAAEFAGVPGVDVLVPALLTVPGLVIAVLAPLAGRVIDRFGRIRLLVGALAAYAVIGTAPLWLQSLPLILASRVLVGVADAAILTCALTLIGDNYSGPKRDRMFGLQTVVASVSAVVFLALGGLVGASSWRLPFALYAVGIVFAVLVAVVLREPPRTRGAGGPTLPPLPWRSVGVACAVTVFGGAMFAIPIVELSFRLAQVGVVSVAVVGLLSAVTSAGLIVGSASFGRYGRLGLGRMLPVGFAAAGVGSVVMGLGTSPAVVTVGAAVASCGIGLLMPTMLTWTVSRLGFEQRGRGSGLFTTCFSLGQFALPFGVLALTGALGGTGGVIAVVGLAAVVVATASPRLFRRTERPST